MRLKKYFHIIYWLFALLSATLLNAEDISVRARLDPTELSVGQYGIYQIEVKGSVNVTAPEAPRVSGLDIQYMGPQRSIINNNGDVQSKITFSYRVSVRSAGDYVIPGNKINVNEQEYVVPGSTLHAVAQTHTQQRQTVSGHFLQGGTYAIEDDEPYVEIDVPGDYLYVGEAVPCKIKLFVPQGMIVMPRGLSFPSHDVFTALPLRQPSERNATGRNGESMVEYSWATVLTPIKEGQFPLSFTLDVVVSSPFRSSTHEVLYGRWPSMVQQMLTSQELQLNTQELKITVAAFPKENKPASFAGAIGQFNLRALDVPASIEVGEPITLTLELEGVGNFERIQAPELNFPTDLWRMYPPKTSFEAKDDLGLIGVKRFEYIIIPQSTEIKEIPEIHFAFFNHAVDAYQEITLPAKPIEVKPSANQLSVTQVAPQKPKQENQATQTAQLNQSGEPQLNLVVNKTHPGSFITERGSVFRDYVFVITQIVLIILLIVFVRKGMIYRRARTNPAWLAMVGVKKEITDLSSVLEKAYKQQHTEKYWVTFERLVHLHIRRIHGIAEELNWSKENIIAYIQEKSPGVINNQELREFFEKIEKLKFAGGLPGDEGQVTQKMHESIRSILSYLQKVAS